MYDTPIFETKALCLVSNLQVSRTAFTVILMANTALIFSCLVGTDETLCYMHMHTHTHTHTHTMHSQTYQCLHTIVISGNQRHTSRCAFGLII